ncbi:MAG: hypothetical protein HC857_01055, partial [Synechococcales cyanobacterium RU_4_20]|nr:hypothetical protein [Synechococcales cyanobacterium RU_4_20]
MDQQSTNGNKPIVESVYSQVVGRQHLTRDRRSACAIAVPTETNVSHSQIKIIATPIVRAEDILTNLKPDTEVVGIDEVQFLGMEVLAVIDSLASKGLRVICAGLDQDYQGKP